MLNEPVPRPSSYVRVYQVLDDVCFRGGVPAGARGLIWSAIDGLRKEAAPSAHIRLAEKVALALHKLDTALRANNGVEAEATRQELQVVGAEWLQGNISCASSGQG